MTGQSMFGAETALIARLPWLKSATVSLWRRLPSWSTRAVTWGCEATLGLAFLVLGILVIIMLLYALYTLGGLVIPIVGSKLW